MFFDKTNDELDKDVNIESKVLLSVLSFLNISILFFPEFFSRSVSFYHVFIICS